MAFEVTNAGELRAGGDYFRAKNHLLDVALLFEPKEYLPEYEDTVQGKTETKAVVLADVTTFANAEALEKGEPSATYKNTYIKEFLLVRALSQVIGGAVVGHIVRLDKGNRPYAINEVPPEAVELVVAYGNAREAAIDAMPDI